MADAVEATWRDAQRETADERAGAERQDLLALGAAVTIILVLDGDTSLVEAVRRRFEIATRCVWRDR